MTAFRLGRRVPPHERPPVCWYHPGTLLRTALGLLSSRNQFYNRDERESQPTPLTIMDLGIPQPQQERDHEGKSGNNDTNNKNDQNEQHTADFWFDFIADTGDGGNATYAVAQTALGACVRNSTKTEKTEKSQNGDNGEPFLPRADLLLFGGDLAYPSAGVLEYRYRFVEMFEAALPPDAHAQPRTIAAIPQNHDWMDSASTFARYFLRHKTARGLLGARIPQRQSYFCARLPHRWWVLGLDFALTDDIDREQFEQFRAIALGSTDPAMGAGDKVILVYPHPVWTTPVDAAVCPGAALRYQLLEGLLGDRIALRLTGDLHHYLRWTSPRGGMLVVCGTGGAFTHPTHTRTTNAPIVLRREANADAIPANPGTVVRMGVEDGPLHPGDERFERVEPSAYPSAAQSRTLALHGLWALFGGGMTWGEGNRWFAALLGGLYLVAAMGAGSLVGTLGALAVFGALCLTIGWEAHYETPTTWGAWRRWGLVLGAGTGHALAHCVLAWSVGTVLPGLVEAWLPQSPGWAVQGLTALGALAVGSVVGALLFGGVLAAMSWCGYLTNNAFSVLGVQDYKGFLRCRIDRNGVLTGHFVAIDRTPRQWRAAAGGQPVWESAEAPIQPRVHDHFTIGAAP
ncbi:metallophosphoesterase family protein [Candidatus Symbiobacter mobilis]|uniref:Calcineurin-like phosphoesterase domain-containing protein n=1 Tax=Candidatus Symbiobacter mobilis CR TaxID=946483 RepID=U5NCS6_9BURK|nr:metallophosphoesterase [Candidatus Symbiobacter mobilis]AGX87969.1 hypothetical protein Cenrod_1890 [Candidatus Symbiobacter mobilis CR]